MQRIFSILTIILAVVLSGPGPARAEPLHVFAAASLGEVLREIAGTWPEPVVVSLGGSGSIARQVDQGAPADVVVLANPQWTAWLQTRGRLIDGTQSTPFGNRLALVGAKALPALTTKTLRAALGPQGRLAMGDRRAVPAGQYAQQWLQSVGLWDTVKHRLAETDNVRTALALVARGEAPLGMVYQTDLKASGVVEAWPIPAADQPRILYAVAAITQEGRDFAAALSAPDAQAILSGHGFLTAETE